MKRFSAYLASGILAFLLSFTCGANAADSEALPHQTVISAIQTAMQTYPGRIKEVEVDRKQGRLVVEVNIIDDSGKSRKVTVDPEKNQVVR